MLIGRIFGIGNNKLAAVVTLLAIVGFAFMAQPAGAATCHGCPDEGGGGDTNSPPTIGVDNASMTVNEGQRVTNTGTYSDPDGNSTVTLSASVGTVTKDDANGIWSWSFQATDGPDESQTVTITATDGVESRTTTFTLTVNNLSPVIYWQSFNPLQPPEGVVRRYEFGVYDPGNDTFTVHDRRCGANGVKVSEDPHNNTITAFHYVECRFPDGPASSVVSAMATDSDWATGTTDTSTVNVVNVAPTAMLNVPSSVDEGGTVAISLTNQNDVQVDRYAGFRYAFACDGGSLDGATYEGSGAATSTNCTFDDSGTKTVRARIIDKDGGYSEYTKEIVVNNVAPTATLNDPASVDQGKDFAISLMNASDPSSADEANLTYAFDCGNGLGYVSSSTASKSCTAVDKPTIVVKAKVIDPDGGSNEYTANVAVNNVAPNGTIKINGEAAATKSATVSLALSATDPPPGSGVGSMRLRNENTGTWSAWEPYATSRSWVLSSGDGTKTVHVQYRDNAGNVSTVTIKDGIQLDTTVPNTTIASGPSGIVKSTSASFGFSSSETGSTFQCKLDGGAFASCASPKSYTNLKNGSHTFKVRAIDVTGNVDTTPAVRSWKVDTIKPTVSGMLPKPAATITDTTPTIKATVKDNLTNLAKGNIRLYVNGKLISATKYTYSRATDQLVYNSPKLTKGKKTVKVVARDAAGNVGVRSWYFTIR